MSLRSLGRLTLLSSKNVLLLHSNNLHKITYIQCPLLSSMKSDFGKFCALQNVNLDIVRYGSKDRGKDKKNKKNVKVEINNNQMGTIIDPEVMKNKYQQSVERLQEDFIKFVTLRSSVGSIETLKVPFDGKDYELQELSQIVRKNPKTLVLNMSSFPQAIPDVLKALTNSGLNLNPQQDGTSVFVPIPKVTKEHREGLAKNAKVLFNKSKDSIKQTELDFIKQAKNSVGVSADLISSVQKQVHALAEDYIQKARLLYIAKSNELLGKD